MIGAINFRLTVAEAPAILSDLRTYVREAVRFYWETRQKQRDKQTGQGTKDQGFRSAVTGGAQMDGFVELLAKIVLEAGIDRSHVFYNQCLELPGYFRPTKQWDFLVVVKGQLIAAIETKSQVGPSFGNNFNNRTEEAMGSALDIWTAFRENAFGTQVRPWLGYLFLLDDCPRSQVPVGVKEPHFKVFEDFRNSSYAKRYEIFCRRLVLERHYDGAAFFLSGLEPGLKGEYVEPAADLSFEKFATSLAAQVAVFSGRIKQL